MTEPSKEETEMPSPWCTPPEGRPTMVHQPHHTDCVPRHIGYAEDRDWWDRIGEMRWHHVVLIVAALAAFVALSFAPPLTFSFSSKDNTEVPGD